MLFAIIRHDKANGYGLRQATRPRHLEYLEKVMPLITQGGALLDSNGQQIGSILFIDVEDLAAAEEFAATDPFDSTGLFATTQVIPFRQVFENGRRI